MATKAIFIGINKHVDPSIPELNGASRDATARRQEPAAMGERTGRTDHLPDYCVALEDDMVDGKHVRAIPRDGATAMRAATAINDRDEIVGIGFNESGGTLLEFVDGALVDVVPLIDNIGPEWDFSGYDGLPAQPTGINERGEISGYGWYDDGSGQLDRRGYILVPN